MSLSPLFESLRLPVVAAPMFLASGPELVAACCEAGIVGTFPALNQRTTQGLEEWLAALDARLASFRTRTGREPAPLGVNLIVHKSNTRLEADLEVLVRHRVPLVITSLGAVPAVIDAVHGYGGLVFHDVTTGKHARKAAEAGVDGLIAVAAGAGGHAGTWSPFALLQEIRKFFDKTVLLAGAITNGGDIAAAQLMGADLAYLGTRLLATRESVVVPEYKQMLIDAGAGDVIYTPAISSIPASFLRQSIIAAGLDPERLAPPEKVDLAHITQPYNKHSGDNEPGNKPGNELGNKSGNEPGAKRPWRDIWSAGQGVGAIADVPGVGELVERLRDEYRVNIAEFEQRSWCHRAP